jgi:hypothetical protein
MENADFYELVIAGRIEREKYGITRFSVSFHRAPLPPPCREGREAGLRAPDGAHTRPPHRNLHVEFARCGGVSVRTIFLAYEALRGLGKIRSGSELGPGVPVRVSPPPGADHQ